MAKSGRKAQPKFRTPPIPHQKLRTGKTLKPPKPTPASLGMGSQDEVDCYMILVQNGIAPSIQQNFDGGSSIMGGQRADFVLYDRRVIIEVVSVWHDLPGAALRDARKWDRRRQEGWIVVTVDKRLPDFKGQVLTAAGHAVAA